MVQYFITIKEIDGRSFMKFNPLEKKSLIALMLVGLFIVTSIYQIGKRNLWFYKKNSYMTKLTSADGLRIGSIVSISGLRVGSIKEIFVDKENAVNVKFSVLRSMSYKITEGTIARSYRAFVVGEKRLDIIPGPKDAKTIVKNGFVVGEDSTSITDLLTGQSMGNMFTKLSDLGEGVGKLSAALKILLSTMNEKDLNTLYQNTIPLVTNLNIMSKDLRKISSSLAKQSKQLPDFFNHGAKVFSSVDNVFRPIGKREVLITELLDNLQLFSKELADNPGFSKQLMKAIQEMTLTLKALQKTWLLEDHVNKVKQEK